MSKSVEKKAIERASPALVYEKTFKFMGIPVFAIKKTVSEEEFVDKISDRVLERVNIGLAGMMPPRPPNS